MVTATIFFTNTDRTGTDTFDDMARAERFAMNVLGMETVSGIVCRVALTDTMLGETTDFEY